MGVMDLPLDPSLDMTSEEEEEFESTKESTGTSMDEDQGLESASLTGQPQLDWSEEGQAEAEMGKLQWVGQEAPG